MRRTAILIGSAFIVIVLAGALAAAALKSDDLRIGYVENSYGNTLHSKFFYFNGTDSRKISLHKGDKVKFVYSIELRQGTLQLQLKDPSGKSVMSESEGSGEVTFKVDSTQDYRMEVVATRAKGSYQLDWSPAL